VSKSGYYKWLKRKDEPDPDYEDYLIVKGVFKDGKSKLGFRAIKMELSNKKGIKMNCKKIIRIKNKYGLITKIRRKSPYRMIMKKSQEHRTFPNILNREFEQYETGRFYTTDITFLPFNGRMAYLCAIKDIASREIVAWHTSMHIDMDIVMDTIEKFQLVLDADISNNNKDKLIHSDQGFHFTSPTFITKVKEMGLVQSMSRKGNCIDNAPMESFFGHLKDHVDYRACKTFDELSMEIDSFMYYYNNERYQWNLKKMTPVQYRDHLLLTAN